MTHADLDRRARAIAVRLREAGSGDVPVQLLFPVGADYVSAFFGCLYGGAVVTPSFPCVNVPTRARLLRLVREGGADVILTTSAIAAVAQRELRGITEGRAIRWIPVDDLPPRLEDGWEWPQVRADSIAIQQASGAGETSRRTTQTHEDLLERSAQAQAYLPPCRHGVTWLPPFQEAALLGTLLQPLYGGFAMTILPPFDFLESPLSWLQLVSRVRAAFTRAPSFAFELSVRKLRYAVPLGLDISCLESVFMEPGPLRAETLQRFVAAFERFGFRRSAFHR